MSDYTGEPCPVCGWGVIREDHIPENPSPDHEPHTHGTLYVHYIESTGNGRFTIDGCSLLENGESEAWQPE